MTSTPIDDEPRAPADSPAAGATASDRQALTRHKLMTCATVGLGSLLGTVIAVPAAVAVLAPVFERATTYPIDLGSTALYPRVGPGEIPWHTVTFEGAPHDGSGLARRLAYIRNDGDQKFTAISNTCMHVGCPVQANATGFACPCHGGQYDSEGRRIAGPPVRPLNRYETSVDARGHLILGELYALDNEMRRHQIKGPGEPVDGPLSDLYPEVPLG
jgi:menaquinol-cytochrome c reductase iron-sulfur subunit